MVRGTQLPGRRRLGKPLRMICQHLPAAALLIVLLAQRLMILRALRTGLKRRGKQLQMIDQEPATAAVWIVLLALTPHSMAQQALVPCLQQLGKPFPGTGHQQTAAAVLIALLTQSVMIRRALRPGLNRLGKQLRMICHAPTAAATTIATASATTHAEAHAISRPFADAILLVLRVQTPQLMVRQAMLLGRRQLGMPLSC